MRAISKTQIEAIEKLGGTIHDDYITFEVENQEYGEHCDDEDKIWNEIQKIIPGVDGAMQGHPLDESDLNYIYFKIDFIPDPKDFINWAELSRTLAGDRSTITRNRISAKHEKTIQTLINSVSEWLISLRS